MPSGKCSAKISRCLRTEPLPAQAYRLRWRGCSHIPHAHSAHPPKDTKTYASSQSLWICALAATAFSGTVSSNVA